ncbi:hypothetical protein GJ496_008252, partial [Pomphorhynchus laevis]
TLFDFVKKAYLAYFVVKQGDIRINIGRYIVFASNVQNGLKMLRYLQDIQIAAEFVKNNDSWQCEEVNLNNNFLHQLQDLTKTFSLLHYLRLDYNLIENLSPRFVPSFTLRVLSLKGNRIRHFDISSNQFKWLTYLDLSNNILSVVKVQNMPDLELRLTGNPNDFELECNPQLTDLRYNRLQSYQIKQKKIYTAILLLDYNLFVDLHFLSSKPYLNTLKFLSCSHNLIRTINEDFFDSAIKLEKLDLSYNCIKYIPNGFLSNKHTISHVNLSFNMITKVNSRDFLNMLGLQDIGLYGNPITVIPSGFLNLSSQLKSVAISLKHLQCLNIRELSNTIEEIELKSTVLTDWELLHGTTGATTISILRSNVTSMDFLYSVKAPYLADINLSFNRIATIKKAQLPTTYNLKCLDLRGNGIRLISDFVYLFNKSIDYLNINRNYNPTERQFANYLDSLIAQKSWHIYYNLNLPMFDLINNFALPQVVCLHSMCIPGKHIERIARHQSFGDNYGYTCPTVYSGHNEFKYL